MHHSVQPIKNNIGWTLWFHRPAAQRFYHDLLDFHCVPHRTAGRSHAKRPADVRSTCGIGWTIGPCIVQPMPHVERTSAGGCQKHSKLSLGGPLTSSRSKKLRFTKIEASSRSFFFLKMNGWTLFLPFAFVL
jgi:hypothetical protein